MKPYLVSVLISMLLMGVTLGYGQTDTLSGIPKLRQLIAAKKIEAAKQELDIQIASFKAAKNYDTLASYIQFVGSHTLANNNWDLALTNAKVFVDTLIRFNKPSLSKQAYKELAWIYDETGKPDKAYEMVSKALEYAAKEKVTKGSTIADLTYNLGYYSGAMGKSQQAKNHYLKALNLVEVKKPTDYVFLQQINNSLGGILWMQGKMDSCNYYFKQSIQALKKTDSSAMNQYFRPGLLKMNMAVVSNILGKNNEAIKFSEEAITNFNTFIRVTKDEQRKNAAKGHLTVAIDNLGVFYNTIGEFSKAEALIAYALAQKKQNKTKNDPNVIISQIILAQAKLNTRKLKEAAQLLDTSIEQLNNSPGVQDTWLAAAYSTRASLFEEEKQFEKAAEHYELAEVLYRQEQKGNYNNDILTEFADIALFHAKHGDANKAIALGTEAYTYVQKSALKNTLQAQTNRILLAEVYLELGNYKKAIELSEEAIRFQLDGLKKSKSRQDSVILQFSKPRAYLIKAKASYAQHKHLSETEFYELLDLLNKGINILEQRKTIITNSEDVSNLISGNEELFNFAKKIHLDYYFQTKKEAVLENILGLHEATIYTRIRARLNLRQDMKYAGVPKTILTREQNLKNSLVNSLESETDNGIHKFFEVTNTWNRFIDSLKNNYPSYYDIRYKKIEASLASIQEKLPPNTTAIRYLFIDSKLYAMVLDKTQKEIVALNFQEVDSSVLAIHENNFDVKKLGTELYKLYNNLWLPLECHIKHSNVLIIPDGALYNLSFEMLTSKPIQSWRDFSNNSLLSKYTISYNFSLLLLNSENVVTDYPHNYVAFAPEFTAAMKNEYQLAVTDSVLLDKTYLTLLPQPFTSEIAEKYATVFQGDAFLNRKASKQFFMKNSGEHKIIHIGTHAESNNIMPELSRLIFAKALVNDTLLDNNSLYTYEIYNQNLASELAILTACETGKPTFQTGEGMISLAHAFRYAGSKSILTSLWQIDEQSSAKIVSHFYDFLKQGQTKDEALKNAKLEYLATATGRTAAPAYWAGLVLIGDTAPIDITSKSISWSWFVAAGLILLVAIVLFLYLRKK
jgi:CHAT domain-containing protein